MNKWKVAFLALVLIIIVATFIVFRMATTPIDTALPPEVSAAEGSVLAIQTTANEFEAIAKQYLMDALTNSPVEIELSIEEQIYLSGEFSVFGVSVPLRMDFDPLIHNGNIRLKQTAVHVGKLNIPPQTVLNIMKESVSFPSWVIVRPKEEEIYVDLSRLTIAENSKVRAKEIDLANDAIMLEVIIPNN